MFAKYILIGQVYCSVVRTYFISHITVVPRPFAWSKPFNMLYIDQPVRCSQMSNLHSVLEVYELSFSVVTYSMNLSAV